MKKTLIALAVAASAVVSGSSVAALGGWTEGQPNGSIDIGGTITNPKSDMKWLWAVGEGMNNYEHTVSQLSNGGTELTVSIDNDTPFLAAKMNKAVRAPITGIIPKVELTSYDQSVAAMNFQSDSSATLTVKVKDGNNDTQIGELVIPLQVGAGGVTYENTSPSTNFARLSVGGAGTMLEGIVKPNASSTPSIALKWSGVTTDDIKNELIASYTTVNEVTTLNSVNVSDSGWVNYADLSHGNYLSTSAARYVVYGAGIPAGSNLALTFNKPITGETQWKAPVTVNVTYQ
ncbi:F41 fimbrial protein [Escherichia coli]|uniref:F4 family fimbrial subunit n=1 Tax=Escherichia coli TaxID=562 RepID=UPI001AE03957|nr:F41 fimbrial protein [Escherichia coli]MBP0551497.1 F41 fimbrial protein [Escherichia coli]